jgi:predicted nucleic acid-binding protein
VKVIDASVALSWCFEDEASPATDALLDEALDHGALVPGLWFLELGNVLLQAERRGRISGPDVTARLELFSALPIFVDQQATGRAWSEILALARAESLTTYDATYLELALRRRAALATKDEALAAAARRHGVAVVP